MGRHRTPEEKAAFKVQATEMRAAGMGVKRIASALHVDPVLIRQLLADVPLPANQMRLRAKDDHRDAAIAMRLEGRSYNEIKAELGVGKGSLSLWLRELPAPSEVQRAALRARAGGGGAPAWGMGGTGRDRRVVRLEPRGRDPPVPPTPPTGAVRALWDPSWPCWARVATVLQHISHRGGRGRGPPR